MPGRQEIVVESASRRIKLARVLNSGIDLGPDALARRQTRRDNLKVARQTAHSNKPSFLTQCIGPVASRPLHYICIEVNAGTMMMISNYRQRPQRGSVCRQCQVVRIFIIGAVCATVFAIVADEQRHYLQMVTPMRAALAICAAGIVGFIFKLIAWKLQSSSAALTDDHEPVAPQATASEEIDHKPSH